jgi:hypothetical protein
MLNWKYDWIRIITNNPLTLRAGSAFYMCCVGVGIGIRGGREGMGER